MAKKKKRKKHPDHRPEADVSTGPFNPAFKDAITVPGKNMEPGQVPRPAPRDPKKTGNEAENLFFNAMADVTPLTKRKNTVTKTPDPSIRPPYPVRGEEMDAIAQLSDLVAGNAEMDITFSDEYMEGFIHGLNPKLMRALRKGTFPFQDYIDLHGLTKQEAAIRLRDFLVRSRALGNRCVLVVHGRGLNSENNVSVIKQNIPAWLKTSPLKHMVLAFCTARPYDGGTGAVYVLLRNPRKGFRQHLEIHYRDR
jgi:DNA-nicking Smr family endonuclease